jgi:hypothetical protein
MVNSSNKKKVLVAVDSIYSCFSTIFKDKGLKNQNLSVDVLFINDKGREKSFEKLKELASLKAINEIWIIKRSFNILIRFYNAFKIRKIGSQYDYLIIGSNVNFEECVLLSSLNKSCKIFGLVPTFLPGMNKPKVDNKNFVGKPSGLYDNGKILKKTLSTALKKTLDFAFYGIRFGLDQTSVLTEYVNKNLVEAHFCYNEYCSYYVSNVYDNESVFLLDDSNFEKVNFKVKPFHGLRIILLGPGNQDCYQIIIDMVKNLDIGFKILSILVRPHPRFEEKGKLLSKKLCAIGYDSKIVSSDQDLSEQTVGSDAIIGYCSALFLERVASETIIIIAEEWSEIEGNNTPTQLQTGSYFGFNKNWAFIDPNGTIFSKLPIEYPRISHSKINSIFHAIEN